MQECRWCGKSTGELLVPAGGSVEHTRCGEVGKTRRRLFFGLPAAALAVTAMPSLLTEENVVTVVTAVDPVFNTITMSTFTLSEYRRELAAGTWDVSCQPRVPPDAKIHRDVLESFARLGPGQHLVLDPNHPRDRISFTNT